MKLLTSAALLNTTLLALLLVIGSCGQDVSELEETTRLAEQGDAIAQFNQGVKYERGNSSQLTKIEIS
mgnify:FL=1|jgi:hypothetical protein